MLRRFWIIIISRNKLLLILIGSFLFLNDSWPFTAKVYSGIRTLKVSNRVFLKIEPYYRKGCNREKELCFPRSKLKLIKNKKIYDHTGLVKPWDRITHIYFIKLSATNHAKDLDGDGNLEIAFCEAPGGNHPFVTAYIYSIVGNKLNFYGTGKFHFEWGPYVKKIVKGQWVEPEKVKFIN